MDGQILIIGYAGDLTFLDENKTAKLLCFTSINYDIDFFLSPRRLKNIRKWLNILLSLFLMD